MDKHTPTPLKIRPARFNGIEKYIVEMVYEDRRDAEAHVRAVNAYERHTKALLRILAIKGSTGGDASLVKEFKTIAAQALDSYDVEAISKAEGK